MAKRPKKSGGGGGGGGKRQGLLGLSTGQLLAAVVVGVVAVLAYFRWTSSLRYLEPSNAEQLKEVFFGRSPWVVLCNNQTESVHETFEAVSRTMVREPLQFGVLDCTEPMKSGKTALQRLKLNAKQKPVVFFAGYGRRPKQLLPKLLSSEYVLVRELKALTKVHAVKAKDAKQLRDACLVKPSCGLVLSGGELDTSSLKTLNGVSDQFPWMSWVIVDASRHRLKNPTEDEVGLAGFSNRKHRVLYVQQANATSADASKPLAMATPHVGPFSASALTAFLKASVDGADLNPSYHFDPKAVLLTKRKEPPPPSPSPSNVPATQDDVLSTEEVERRRAARRASLEAKRRERMDAEAEEFGISEEDEGTAQDELGSSEDGEDYGQGEEDEEEAEDEEDADVLELD